MHPFVKWLVEHHGKADTPVGDLARDLRYHSSDLPFEGDQSELRDFLELNGVDSWALDAFDEAWKAWKTCSSPGCTAKAAGGSSSLCPMHGGRSHHAGAELL